MEKKKVKSKSKGRRRYYQCRFFRAYYDDLERLRLCERDGSGSGECICKSIFQFGLCPYFEKGGTYFYLKPSESDLESAREFAMRAERERDERKTMELAERAAAKRLGEIAWRAGR